MRSSISSITAIRALSDEGARLFEQQLGWLNPLPDVVDEIFERIRFAIERSEYVADRSGKITSDPAQLAALRFELERMVSNFNAANQTIPPTPNGAADR